MGESSLAHRDEAPVAPSLPCRALRFSWGTAGSGAVLFLAGMVGAAGSWAVSAGALSITLGSIAGVIAMEGREGPAPASPPTVLDRPLSRSV